MTAFDPYATLGVPRNASRLQLARARRRLAKRYHPDLHPGAASRERMQRINEAWEILSSPMERARYDARTGSSGVPAWTPPGSGNWSAATAAGPATVRWTRRPWRMPPRDEPRSFRDSGWAAAIVAAVVIATFFAAVYLGSVTAYGP
jgi:curved DNA-binding protein CbpA